MTGFTDDGTLKSVKRLAVLNLMREAVEEQKVPSIPMHVYEGGFSADSKVDQLLELFRTTDALSGIYNGIRETLREGSTK